MQLLRSVRPPLATRLALQHAALLGGMSHEFAALDEPALQQSLPRHCATMKAYQAELLACGAANSAALATVFGRAEDHGADRLRSVVWPWLEPLAGTAEDEYEHLGVCLSAAPASYQLLPPRRPHISLRTPLDYLGPPT